MMNTPTVQERQVLLLHTILQGIHQMEQSTSEIMTTDTHVKGTRLQTLEHNLVESLVKIRKESQH